MNYSNKVILIDFGATRIKSIVVDRNSSLILDSKEVLSPSRQSDSILPNVFEVDIKKYYQCFLETALYLANKHNVFKIFVCSEMHGFCLFDIESNLFSPYISWKDSRVDVKNYKSLSPWFFEKTGMKLRPGLPFLNLKSFNNFKNKKLFCTLLDAILILAGCKNLKTDYSLGMATGLINLSSRTWDKELYELNNLQFNPLNYDSKLPIATLNNIQIYGGIGDLQAAILGVGLDNNALINLGTGSQIVCSEHIEGYESRPLLNNKVNVITHIPCGRALNIFANFFYSITTDENFFWNCWNQLSVNEILSAQENVDLNMFDAAYNYSTKSGYIKIREGRSNYKFIVADLAKSWVLQYIRLLNKIDCKKQNKTVKVSGGLAHKSKFLITALSELDKTRNYILFQPLLGEETLDGLYKLSK